MNFDFLKSKPKGKVNEKKIQDNNSRICNCHSFCKNHYVVKIDLINMIGIFCLEHLENNYCGILLNQNSCGVKACQYKHII